MTDTEGISAEFPFEPHYVEVEGSRMHYVEEGTGDPILFLHGNPTSSYLWRNIIPHLSSQGRCIAPDLVGFGKSDKPDLGYRFFDHVKYVDGFIEKLGLENITFVIHDWGSALGFHYAMRHEDNVKALAFMEAIVVPLSWESFPKDFKTGFRMFRTPGVGWAMIVPMNAFLKKVLPEAIVRDLTDEELDHYMEPFPTWRSRKPIRRMPRDIPIDGNPADVAEAVQSYSRKLQQSELPKLLLTADPGGLISPARAAWAEAHLRNLKIVDIGPGIHYLQEDNPHQIGREIAAWREGLGSTASG